VWVGTYSSPAVHSGVQLLMRKNPDELAQIFSRSCGAVRNAQADLARRADWLFGHGVPCPCCE
jgi:hypothetical protein